MFYSKIFSLKNFQIALNYLIPLFVIIILFLILDLFNSQGIIDSQLIPGPSIIFQTISSDQPVFLQAFAETLTHSFFSLWFSVFLGITISIIFSLNIFLKNSLLPIAVFFQTVPIIAIAPLLVIYFGFGTPTIITTSIIVSIFPIIANTLKGLDSTDPQLVSLFKIYHFSKIQTLFKLKIPFAFNYIQVGIRISAGLSVIGTVAGEFVAGSGLGSLIDSARTQQRIDIVFSCLILLAMCGLLQILFVNILFYSIKRFRHF